MIAVSTEKNIQAAILQWLNTIPGVRVWRQNSGGMLTTYTSKRTGKTKTRAVKFGEPGMADLSGIGPGGVRIEIEIKKPGELPRQDQSDWLLFIQYMDGIAFWCDSLRECNVKLRYEFERRGWTWKKEWECY